MRAKSILCVILLLAIIFPASAADLPVKMVLTIDVSGSMGGEKIEKAKNGAVTFLDVLVQYDSGKDDEVALVTFSNDVHVLSDLTNDFDRLRSLISTLSATGSTSMWDAVYYSVDLLKNDPSEAKAVLLLTDGQDNDSEHTKKDAIQHAKNNKVRIFVVGVGADVNDDDLRELAEETGGSYWHINVANLVYIYEMIALKMSLIFPPDAEITYSPQHPKVGEVVTFDASQSSSPKGIVTYNWLFSDGTTAQGVVVTHVFTKPGNHTVALTVYDSDYIPDTEIITVNVSGNENIPFDISILPVQLPPYYTKEMINFKVFVSATNPSNVILEGYVENPNGSVTKVSDFQFAGSYYLLSLQLENPGSYTLNVVGRAGISKSVAVYKFVVYEDTLNIHIINAPSSITAGLPLDVEVSVTNSMGEFVSGCVVMAKIDSKNSENSVVLFSESAGKYAGEIIVFEPGEYTVNITVSKAGYIPNNIELKINIKKSASYSAIENFVLRSNQKIEELYNDLGTSANWLDKMPSLVKAGRVGVVIDVMMSFLSIGTTAMNLAKEPLKGQISENLKEASYVINYASFDTLKRWSLSTGKEFVDKAGMKVLPIRDAINYPLRFAVTMGDYYIVSSSYNPLGAYHILGEYKDYLINNLKSELSSKSLLSNVANYDQNILNDVINERLIANSLQYDEASIMIKTHDKLFRSYIDNKYNIYYIILKTIFKFGSYVVAYFASNMPCVLVVEIFWTSLDMYNALNEWQQLDDIEKALVDEGSILSVKGPERMGTIYINTADLLDRIKNRESIPNPEGKILDVNIVREGRYRFWNLWWCDERGYFDVLIKNTGNEPSEFSLYMLYTDESGNPGMILTKKIYLEPNEEGKITVDWYNKDGMNLNIEDRSSVYFNLLSVSESSMNFEDLKSTSFNKEEAIKTESSFSTAIVQTTTASLNQIVNSFKYPITRDVLLNDNGTVQVSIIVKNPLPLNTTNVLTITIPSQTKVVKTDGQIMGDNISWNFMLRPFENEQVYAIFKPFSTKVFVNEAVLKMCAGDYGCEIFNTTGDVVQRGSSPIPIVKIMPENPSIKDLVEFNASESYDLDGNIVNYLWDFGDGSTASGQKVTHTYSSPGTYTVTLTVTDNDGLTSSISKQITVKQTDQKEQLKQQILNLILQYLTTQDTQQKEQIKQQILQLIIQYLQS